MHGALSTFAVDAQCHRQYKVESKPGYRYFSVKLIMTYLVRDEADVIRSNIEFHLARGVDGIVAIDNGSRDGTRDILDEYARAGVAVVFDEPGRNYAQSKWVTRAALYARDTLAADWIINNDADEFWVAPGGTLKTAVQGAGIAQLNCPRRNMICAHERLDDRPWVDQLVYRVADPVQRPAMSDIYTTPLPCPYLYLDLPPKAMVRARDLTEVAQGNHSAKFAGRVESADAEIEIFHFPVRSRAQFERKVVQGGEAYMANTELPEGMGWHWRRWYRIWQGSGLQAVLDDVLPSEKKLAADLGSNTVLADHRLSDMIRS